MKVTFVRLRETADFAEFRCSACGYVVECTPDNVVQVDAELRIRCPSCDRTEGEADESR